MKNIIFSFFVLLLSIKGLAQTITTTDTSSPNSCDGSAFFADTIPNTDYYEWQDQFNNVIYQGGSNIDSLCSGNYIVNVVAFDGQITTFTFIINNGNGVDCSSLQVQVSVIQQPSSSSSFDGILSANASGGAAPYSYVWYNGMTTQDANGVGAGYYEVCITDMNGCLICTTGTVNADSVDCNNLSVSAVQTQNVSADSLSNGIAAVTISGGTPMYTIYQIINNDTDTILSGGPSTYTLANLPVGQLCVQVVDVNNCTAQYCIPVVSDSLVDPCSTFMVSVQVNQNASSPNSSDGSLTATATGGTGTYSYTWSNGMNGQTISNLPTGSYQVCVSSIDGCSACEFGFITYDSIIDPCFGFSVTATTSNASSPVMCDGAVTINPIGGTAPYQIMMNGTVYSQLSVANLCAGNYNPIVTDSQGCGLNVQFTIDSNSDTTNYPFTANVYTTNTTSENVCDGTAYYDVSGGVAPYSFVNADGINVNQYESNLCEGVYSIFVTDANGQLITLNYFIASPNNIIDNTTFEDSLVVDTLFNEVLEDCLIDFLTLDTAFISNIEFVSMDSIVVTWSIIDGNGTIEIVESYSLTSGLGVYELMLQIFCPQRAVDKYLIVIEQFKIGGSFIGIEEKNDAEIVLYPNPIQDQLNIKVDFNSETLVFLTDITGKVVYQQAHSGSLVQINTSELAKGQYFVHLQNEHVNTTKVVVK